MPHFDYFNRMEYLDDLIRRKATGSPKELARKLSVSERTVYELINKLKMLDAPISYDFQRRTYFYQNPGNFRFRFSSDKE